MPQITRESLMTLEAYAKARPQFRAKVMAHKKHRMLQLGAHLTLIFEDELTVRYQIQEMLRAERTYEEAGIQDELDAYNPLVPDGANWKVTLMIEYPDVEERHRMLARLIGIEDRVWVQVGGAPRVYAIADEDLERDTVEKTSAVHFLRFELEPAMVESLKKGAPIAVGVDHPEYSHTIGAVDPAVRASLAGDLAG
jgi:TusA-related sulfurtransferase